MKSTFHRCMGLMVTSILILEGCSSVSGESVQPSAAIVESVNDNDRGTEGSLTGDLEVTENEYETAIDNAGEAKDILIDVSDYSILGIDDNYFDEFETAETIDEQTLQLLELQGTEFDKAITYEDYFNGHSPDNNLILIASFEDDSIRVFGTLTENSNELIIDHNGKGEAFHVGWGAGYKDPVICLFDYDEDGDKELVISAMAWHGTGVYRDGLYVFEIEDDITFAKMEERDIADQLSQLISVDFDKQSVVRKDGSDIVSEIPFSTYIDKYNENRTDKENTNTDYEIRKLDIVSFWEISVKDENVILKVRPSLYINGEDFSDYACLYDNDTGESQVFSFKVSYDGKGFKLLTDKATDASGV